jgi:hypothetical protein
MGQEALTLHLNCTIDDENVVNIADLLLKMRDLLALFKRYKVALRLAKHKTA